MLFNVSIINKYDMWMEDDENDSSKWLVMDRQQLESILKRKIRRNEEEQGTAIINYDDIIWRKFI
jgi:hypothetical protein